MKSESFDLQLKNLLVKAVLLDYREPLTAPDDGDDIWSLPYRRQREKMLSDAKKWARSKLRPVWKRTLQQVACLLLAAALTLGAAMTISPTVRAAVINWVRIVYETVVEYRFRGEANEGALPKYVFTSLPEKYEVVAHFESDNQVTIMYENKENEKEEDMIALQYMYMSEGALTRIDTENTLTTWTLEEVDINGHPADCFVPEELKYGVYLLWIDEETNLQFIVSGTAPKESIIALAENIEKCE